jgi:hypothetical protein
VDGKNQLEVDVITGKPAKLTRETKKETNTARIFMTCGTAKWSRNRNVIQNCRKATLLDLQAIFLNYSVSQVHKLATTDVYDWLSAETIKNFVWIVNGSSSGSNLSNAKPEPK